MKIEDIVQLLNNRLREFKLSRNYASMNGDLEKVNANDKEILDLEDTIFKLNLLVDTTKSASVKEEILTEVMTDGSVSVLGEYDITPYATDPLHEEKIMNILSKMGVMDTAEKIDNYISGKCWSSPVTGEMVISASEAYNVDARLMMAIMQQDSSFGTAGLAVRTLNPGNVGNDDAGNIRTYGSWQEGVTAVAEWLNRHRISENGSKLPPEIILDTMVTSTPAFVTSTVDTTPPTTTPPIDFTPPTTTPPLDIAPPTTTPPFTTPPTTTPPITTPPADTTPPTTTPPIDFTPPTTTPPLDIAPPTSTPEIIPIITPTTTDSNFPPTSIIETIPAVTSTTTAGTTTPATDTPNSETIPVITSTTTTVITTSTE